MNFLSTGVFSSQNKMEKKYRCSFNKGHYIVLLKAVLIIVMRVTLKGRLLDGEGGVSQIQTYVARGDVCI